MGNWVNLDNALSMVGNLLLWLWSNGLSVSIGGVTFDLPFAIINRNPCQTVLLFPVFPLKHHYMKQGLLH